MIPGALIVTIGKNTWTDKVDRKRCHWLGHASYKCAGCRLGYIKVRTFEDFDKQCSECNAHVFVERDHK